MDRGLTFLLWLGCAAFAGAVAADQYGRALAGQTAAALLSLGAVLLGLFVWRELRAP